MEDKQHMETEWQASVRMKAEGFEQDFRLDRSGAVVADDRTWAPTDFTIVDMQRFEGQSNPDDASILLAVESPDGRRGTLILPYGPDATPEQADAMREMLVKHRDAGRP